MNNLNSKKRFTKNIIALSLGLALSACGGSSSDDNVTADVNSAPTISSTAVTTIESGTLYSYSLVAADSNGDTLTMSAANLPDWLTFDSATGILSGTATESDAGDTAITLTVSDGIDDTTQSFTISVVVPEPVNNAPVITSTGITAATASADYSYTLAATDADSDSLTMSAPTKPAWLTFDEATGILSGSPANSDEGDHAVVLAVTDGSDETTQSFTITVSIITPENTAPEITSTSVINATVDTAYTYTLTATDADSDTLTMSADIPTALSWLTFDSATGILSGTPTSSDVAATSITLKVNDGTVDTLQTFTITVAEELGERVPAFVVYEDDANPLWPAWDCCGSSTPAIITDSDTDYGQVTQFTINGDTVVGFNARDAVDGVAYDTPAGTTLEFDLKVTSMPADDTTPWFLKIEDSSGGDSGDVNLNTSAEGLVPVLDTWMHYTFNVAALGRSDVNLIMLFPQWGAGDGAEYSIDNVKFYFDADTEDRTPGNSGDGATTTTAVGIDFEGDQLTWGTFDTAKVQYVANPNTDGSNTSATVALLDIIQLDGEWAGARTEGIDTFALDASNCVVEMDVYRNTIGLMHVKFEKNNGVNDDGIMWGSAGTVSVSNTLVNQWETLTFDTCAWIGHAETGVIDGFAIHADQTNARSQDTLIHIDNIMFTAQGDVPPTEPPVAGDLVANGSFDDGATGWDMGGAVIDEGGNNVFEATVAAPGDVWAINLSQKMTLVAGQAYTFTFKAKAAVARTIVAGLGFYHDPWTATTENVVLTTDWATYTYTITPDAGDDNSRVLFDMGGEAGNVYLDDISVIAVQ